MVNDIKLFGLLLVMLISCQLNAQNSGFIGKRNIISLDTRLFTPAFYNILTREDKFRNTADGANFKNGRNLLSGGLNISVGRTLSNKVAFHIQGSVLNYKSIMQDFDANGSLNGKVIQKATFFNNRAIGIMPILEFANSSGISPYGLSNQIGLGFYSHKLLKGEYLVLTQGFPNFELINEDELFDYDKNRVLTYSIMYKLNLRLAINRSVLFNLGFRYNLNITRSEVYYEGNSEEFGFTERDYRNLVRRAQVTNFVSMETGLSFVF